MKKQTLWLGTAVAALLLMPFPQAFAQSGPSDPDAIDYSALYNRVYDYAALKQAKADDLSDTQIAKLVKIAEKCGAPFMDLVSAVSGRGETFPMLCNEHGVPLSDLNHVQKQKDEIANYQSAYETSGRYAVPKRHQ